MPATFTGALRAEFSWKQVAMAVVGLVVFYVVFRLDPLEIALFFLLGVALAAQNAAVEASLLDRRLLQVGYGLALAALGISGVWFGPDTISTVVLATAAVVVGGWIVLDALTARWAGIESPDGPTEDLSAATVMTTMALAHEVYDALRSADGPLSTEDVADACELAPSRAERVLDLTVSQGMVVETGEGYVANEAYAGRLSWARTVAGDVFARLARPFRLLGSSRHA